MPDDVLYQEKLSSPRTSALFAVLTIVFLTLFLLRVNTQHLDTLAIIFLVFCLFFLFYTINYYTLFIQLTDQALKLKFGLFKWTIHFSNIASASLDDLPAFNKYGGAGIHFMTVNGCYRASFNFLEYPRLRITLKKKSGLVQDISFSTRRPEEMLRLIHAAI